MFLSFKIDDGRVSLHTDARLGVYIHVALELYVLNFLTLEHTNNVIQDIGWTYYLSMFSYRKILFSIDSIRALT